MGESRAGAGEEGREEQGPIEMKDDQGNPTRAPAWIGTIPPGRAQSPLREIYDGIAGRSGTVANILLSQSLHPEGLRDHYALYRTLMFGRGELSRAQREAIAVAVSRGNGCRY